MTMEQELKRLKKYALKEHKRISRKYVTDDFTIDDNYNLEVKRLDHDVSKKMKAIISKYDGTIK